MKALVKRRELLEGVRAVAPFVAKTPFILQNVRMALSGRRNGLWITIEAMNGRQAVCFEVEAQEAVDGDPLLIDYGRLLAFLKADWGEEIHLERVGPRLIAKGHTKASFAVEAAESWTDAGEPPEGEWAEVGAGVREEMGRALPFVGKADFEHVIGRLLWVGEGWIFAGTNEAVWTRTVESPVPFHLDVESARLLLGLCEGESRVEILGAAGRWWFRGASWSLTTARPETGGIDPRTWFDSLYAVEDWQDLPALVNVIPTLEAVAASRGERAPLRIDPDGTGGAQVSAWSDLVGGEGRIPCPFPQWATLLPEKALAILRELQRVAGTDRAVRVGSFGGGYLRFEIEGEATALLAGVKV